MTDAQRDEGQRGQGMYLGRKRDGTLKLGHYRRNEESGYPQRMEGYYRGNTSDSGALTSPIPGVGGTTTWRLRGLYRKGHLTGAVTLDSS